MTAAPLQRATGAPLTLNALLQERSFGDLREHRTPICPSTSSRRTTSRRMAKAGDLPSARRSRMGSLIRGRPAPRVAISPWSRTAWCVAPSRRGIFAAGRRGAAGRWENASLTITEAGAPWRVHTLNSIAHLDGLSVA
jgi:hypothetical protein